MCALVCAEGQGCASVSTVPIVARGGIRCPNSGAIDGSEHFNMGAGNKVMSSERGVHALHH